MTDLVITESDVGTFRTKLEQWGAGLSDGENAILQMLIVRAFPEMAPSGEPEVEGFDQKNPAPKGNHGPHDFTFTHLYDKASPVLARSTPLNSFVGIHFGTLAAE